METELRKVRVLQNDGVSPLIRIEDQYGTCSAGRRRVHKVGNDYILSSERQAEVARQSLVPRPSAKPCASPKKNWLRLPNRRFKPKWRRKESRWQLKF